VVSDVAGLPVVSITGTVVADPELRFGATGTAVGKFRLAVNERVFRDGSWVDSDRHLFIGVTCFKQLAENVAESFVKGDKVVALGTLQTDEWETEAGDKRSQIVLIANDVAGSVMFRTIKHNEGRTARSTAPAEEDPWRTGSDEPPF
jgi:single-strand DNA-binding protein